MRVVDLNADLGESYGSWRLGDDSALLPLITSANIACGFHAGDPLTLRQTVALAVRHSVVIGAQVSYPDLVGFGRRQMDMGRDELEADVLYQIAALDGLARSAGTVVRYLKPHGALYHCTLKDGRQAEAVVAAVLAWPTELPIVTMAGGALAVCAERAGLHVVREGFADRAYAADGSLVPRSEPGSVLHDSADVAGQALGLVAGGQVDSICLHGDTPGAVAHAVAVRQALAASDVPVRSFV